MAQPCPRVPCPCDRTPSRVTLYEIITRHWPGLCRTSQAATTDPEYSQTQRFATLARVGAWAPIVDRRPARAPDAAPVQRPLARLLDATARRQCHVRDPPGNARSHRMTSGRPSRAHREARFASATHPHHRQRQSRRRRRRRPRLGDCPYHTARPVASLRLGTTVELPSFRVPNRLPRG